MTTRSKTVAAWLAIVGGTFGLHRIYLHGARDVLAWLHPWPTLLGVAGWQRLRQFGADDRAAWVLLPLLGVMVVQSMGAALWHALSNDERWNARHNAGGAASHTGALAVTAAVVALALGAGSLMATLAFVFQHLFEAWQ